MLKQYVLLLIQMELYSEAKKLEKDTNFQLLHHYFFWTKDLIISSSPNDKTKLATIILYLGGTFI